MIDGTALTLARVRMIDAFERFHAAYLTGDRCTYVKLWGDYKAVSKDLQALVEGAGLYELMSGRTHERRHT